MAAIKKELEEQVTCAICLEQFKDPRVLPCLHTYCKVCLENLVTKTAHGNKVACPGCRDEVQMTVTDVSRLKTNFWINNLLSLLSLKSEETEEVKIVCEMCDSHEKAEGRCVECGEFMCEFCITYHRRQKATKHHDILTLEEIKTAGKVPTKVMYCAKHKGEALKLYCNTCGELVCRDCTIVDHRDHKYLFIGDVVEKEKAQIQEKIKETTDKASAIEKTLLLVQEERCKLEVKVQSAKAAVDELIDKRIRELQDMRVQLKNDIQAINSLKTKQLVAQEEELNLRTASINSSVEFTCRVCAEGSDVDILSVRKEVMERLSDLAKQPVDAFPCVCGDVRMNVDKQAWSLPYDAVQVYDCEVDPQLCTITMGTAGEPGVVYSTFTGQAYTFTVTVKRKRGEKVLSRPEVRCIVENTHFPSDPYSPYNLEIKKMGNGVYHTSCQPLAGGLHRLLVTVNGRHIKGSPLDWNVKPKVNLDELLATTLLRDEDTVTWRMRVKPRKPNGQGISIPVSPHFGIREGEPPELPHDNDLLSYCAPMPHIVKLARYWANGVKYTEQRRTHQTQGWGTMSFAIQNPETIQAPSNIKSFDEGDVICVYLRKDQQKAKIILCNETKCKWDEFVDISPPVHLDLFGQLSNMYELDFQVPTQHIYPDCPPTEWS